MVNRLDETSTDQERLYLIIDKLKERINQTDIVQAQAFADVALKLATKLKDEVSTARIYLILGSISARLMQYDDALSLYYKALQLNEKNKRNKEIAENHNSIGSIYMKMGDYEKAEDCLIKAYEYYPNSSTIVGNMGLILTMRNKHEQALEYLLKAEKLVDPLKNANSYIILLTNIAASYNVQKCFKESLAYLDKALTFSATHENIAKFTVLLNYGITLWDSGNKEEAGIYLEQAEQEAIATNSQEYLLEISNAMSAFYEAYRDFEKAYRYAKKSSELNAKLIPERFMSRIADLHNQYELHTKELENRRLLEQTAKLSSIGVMAAGITHEINQPLCAIKVNADGILYWLKRNKVDLPHHFSEDLQQISDAVERIDKIIQHIRSFWTLPEREISHPISLNATIQQAIQLIERQTYSHGIFLEMQLSEKNLTICAEVVPIEEIVINLVVNAIQSLDETDSYEKKIIIRTEEDNEKILMHVIDNGKGIPEELGRKLFDPFFTKKVNGMGLGLAIVHLYAQQYDATVSYENNSDKGVTFTLSFPKEG